MNLNTATFHDLQRLPGVGRVSAQCIVKSRPFSSVLALSRVKGIGPVRFAAITAQNQIYVNESFPKVDATAKCKSALTEIDLNTASKRQLQQLNGVGPALAQRIIDARPLYRKEDLLAVKGIGTKSYVKMQVGACVKGNVKIVGGVDTGNGNDVDEEIVSSHKNIHNCSEIEKDVRESVLRTSYSHRDNSRALLVASWNIRNISRRKKVYLLQRIAYVLDEFDIVALQEVRDLIVLKRLRTMLPGWDYEVSETVGRKTPETKKRIERYAFFYRSCAVRLVEKCSLIEDSSGVLVRLPCVASFQATKMLGSSKLVFSLMNVHVSFGAKESRHAEIVEINRLANEMTRSVPNKRVVVLGDFNLSPQDVLNILKLNKLALIHPPLSTTVFNKLYDNIWINRSDFSCCNDDDNDYVIDSGVLRIDWRFYPLSKSRCLTAPNLLNTTMPPRLQAYMSRVQCGQELSDHCPVWVAITAVQKRDCVTGSMGYFEA